MKKQLLLSTLAIAAFAGYLHADESNPQDSTRDRDRKEVSKEASKEVSDNVKRSVAKVVVVAEETKDAEEKKSDVTRNKGKKDKKEKNDKK